MQMKTCDVIQDALTYNKLEREPCLFIVDETFDTDRLYGGRFVLPADRFRWAFNLTDTDIYIINYCPSKTTIDIVDCRKGVN